MKASSARSTTTRAPAAAGAVSALKPSAAVQTSSSPRSATTTQPARSLFSALSPGIGPRCHLWDACGVSARTYGFSLLRVSLRQKARAITRASASNILHGRRLRRPRTGSARQGFSAAGGQPAPLLLLFAGDPGALAETSPRPSPPGTVGARAADPRRVGDG